MLPPPSPSSLQGVPVAYDNIKVVGELGDIYDDQGFIHLNIEADFVIFSPKKGKKLVVRKRVDVLRGIFFNDVIKAWLIFVINRGLGRRWSYILVYISSSFVYDLLAVRSTASFYFHLSVLSVLY